MKIYFLRHADAVDGDDDAMRPLSPLGRKQSEAIAAFLAKADVNFGAAFTSPLVRAHQTAEIVLRSMGKMGDVKLRTAEALLNETSDAEWNRWLESILDTKHVLLVGHAPTLAERVCALLTIENSSALRLAKGAVACVESEDRQCGQLKYLVTPKSLGL